MQNETLETFDYEKWLKYIDSLKIQDPEFRVTGDGIEYGDGYTNKMIIPKEIFVKAYEEYILKGDNNA